MIDYAKLAKAMVDDMSQLEKETVAFWDCMRTVEGMSDQEMEELAQELGVKHD